jgi:methylenetetrahydrofolate--tRNA-(uracil-5-)-methyltransferase
VVTIVGGGLAGSEIAWQLTRKGIRVNLFEMRPKVKTEAHKTGDLAELVCSNSFRGASLTNAVGLLKEELRVCGSLIMEAADFFSLPAGGALAVDRVRFSKFITEKLRNEPLIEFHEEEVVEIPDSPCFIATGPLTSEALAKAIATKLGEGELAFYDAIAPIVYGESINWDIVFKQSRYDKGGDDYANVPLSKDEYLRFIELVKSAEKVSFGPDLKPFEGCMPIEDMVERGDDTLRYGPLKPVGLIDPRTGKRPHAVVQLRQDDKEGHLWNMVGFQTRMKFGEQKKVIRTLPGLENAEFVRMGSLHRNTFINSPKCLNPSMELRDHSGVYIAGQLTGVEGYVESTASGMAAARHFLCGDVFPEDTAIGSLCRYVSDPNRKDFQPMNISFGLMGSYFTEDKVSIRDKDERRLKTSNQALLSLKRFLGITS